MLDVGFYISDEAGDIIETLAVGMESDKIDVGASGGDCGQELDEPITSLERGDCRGRGANAESCVDERRPYICGGLRIFLVDVGLIGTEDGFVGRLRLGGVEDGGCCHRCSLDHGNQTKA